MKILITGGAGYIGSQLIRDLGINPLFVGSQTIIFENMQNERYQSLMNLPSSGSYDFFYGDIRDERAMEKAAEDCDVIIHLAALTNAVISFGRREETEKINWLGTQNVLKAALNSPTTRRVVYASTCSVYGETQGIVNEDSECHPESPYATYKLEGERATMRLAEESGGRVTGTALRLATVYGLSPGLRVHTVVNKFALEGALGMPLTVHGNGEQKRPFLHVCDASSAFVFALQDERTCGQILNVVGENASVNQILSYVRPRFPKLIVEHNEGRHLNQISYEVDGSRIQSLGWQPKITVEDGIEEFAQLVRPFAAKLGGVAAIG